jgi:molecular chaperone GrpE
LAATEAGSSQTTALLRHLTDPARSQALDERLASLLVSQEAGQEQWRALASSLNDLGQTVAKLNRTQFKSNALAEMKDQQVTTALGTLQEVAARRDQAQEARSQREQERAAILQAEARGEFAADLLPALDGLEMALESGRAFLERRKQESEALRRAGEQAVPAAPSPAPPTFWQRLAWALWGRGLPPGAAAPSAPAPLPFRGDETIAALEAWLQGLAMVCTRFLALLATADIYPIEAKGQRFDPRLHLAMGTETRPDAPDETVVATLRKGYRQRARVLRYAEVVVNHVTDTETEAAPEDTFYTNEASPAQQEDHVQLDGRKSEDRPQ